MSLSSFNDVLSTNAAILSLAGRPVVVDHHDDHDEMEFHFTVCLSFAYPLCLTQIVAAMRVSSR